MLVYHFLPAKHALDDLTKKRLKISQIDELNDPFELSCVAQPGRKMRATLARYRRTMGRGYGMLCFSKNWHNTVLWSHYADKHRGICLGLDIGDRYLRAVDYIAERPPLKFPPTEDSALRLLYTKYRDWSYEEELRAWVRLDNRDPLTGLCFYHFNDTVKLREVIVGTLCPVSQAQIETALRQTRAGVRVIKARLAFNSFQVVENLRGFHA